MAKKRAKPKDDRHIPIPEAIDGERWFIQRSPARGARVAPTLRKMLVPYEQGDIERTVRAHEMTHVSIAPVDMEWRVRELHPDLVNNVEDGRVHGQMARTGFEIREMEGLISDEEIESMALEAHPAVLAALGVAMSGTGEDTRVRRQFLDRGAWEDYHPDPEDPIEDAETAEMIARLQIFDFGRELAKHRMHAPAELPSFDETEQIVEEIVELFGEPDGPPPPPGIFATPELVPASMFKHYAKHGLEKVPTIAPRGRQWTTMTIEEPARPIGLPGKMRHKIKKIPEVRGRRLRRIGRLHHDGRVFHDKMRKRGGGAVLVDTSGSMGLDPDDVIQLCLKYPAGVIAAYSSLDEQYPATGTLRVIARNGRRVPDEEMDPPGYGNGCDGPALDWLAKQPGPRWWVSDTHVSCGEQGLIYCLDVCRRNNITIVREAWEILGRDV